MLATDVWRLVTMVSAETARFSASGTGLADTTRPKVKAAKQKEAARTNNIVAEIERFVKRSKALDSNEQRLLDKTYRSVHS